jgi:uncharacterized protein
MPVPSRLPDALVIVYLHGFASSPKSTKAGYFAERLRGHGLTFRCPDLNEPDFSTLTLSRMLERVEREISAVDEASITLMGSSLGGTLAILAAERWPSKVESLVLLAPAIAFAKPGHRLLPPDRIEEWRRRGSMPFYHYAFDEERPLDVEFYEDSLRYDALSASFAQPTLVFHGLRDASVDYRTVEAFSRARRNVTLSLLDDGHQLVESLPRIWPDVEAFLGLID